MSRVLAVVVKNSKNVMESPSKELVCCQCGVKVGKEFFPVDIGQGKKGDVICGKCYVSGKGDPRYPGRRSPSDEGSFSRDSGIILPSGRFYRR